MDFKTYFVLHAGPHISHSTYFFSSILSFNIISKSCCLTSTEWQYTELELFAHMLYRKRPI